MAIRPPSSESSTNSTVNQEAINQQMAGLQSKMEAFANVQNFLNQNPGEISMEAALEQIRLATQPSPSAQKNPTTEPAKKD